MNPTKHIDIVIVGAGIMGLALAYAEAKRGRKVLVLEKDAQTLGASIRNFGMVWPVGQAAGPALNRALKSKAIWSEVAPKAGFWHAETGSLHLAYRSDELKVLEEFSADADNKGYQVQMLTASEAQTLSPAVKAGGLRGAMWSGTEMLVEPREVPASMASYLQQNFEVEILFGQTVSEVGEDELRYGSERVRFDRCYVCSGANLQTLFPDILLDSELVNVKLQMMRTSAQNESWKLGPSLAAGLTLTHYASFAHCHSLPALKARFEKESPWFHQWGIHVMLAQNGKNELIIGDSHEYAQTHDPFLKEEINQHILTYLQGFARIPKLQISDRWYGIYAKLPGKTEFIAQPFEKVKIVTGLSGAGMTQSFGLAEELVEKHG